MIKIKEHIVTDHEEGIRLVDYAINLFDELPTKSSVKKAIKKGLLFINEKPGAQGDFIQTEMKIDLYELDNDLPKPYDLPIPVIYEDSELCIVNKPAGLTTTGNQFRTLENCLVDQIDQNNTHNPLKWPKPVHRLDKPTCGLVMVAKSIEARHKSGQAFEHHEITKTYHALVMGRTPKIGTITKPIQGKEAKTNFTRIREVKSIKNDTLTLLKLIPETGRTHQLRIHCSASGFSIFGDKEYAEKTIRNKGLFLAATGLAFKHPISGERLTIDIPIPDKFILRMENESRRWKNHHEHGD